ncbi:MAG: hypothetical protein COB83_10415 [Gammaproteobacteria bacterium]|nr:MAG: hypothetical protein COB83_11850 [Gammaproteobacteria bacterium]PCH94804.1 MAG: hypothetical protein COB83_10415 [Gammaproteobacteria bacterium]
MLKTVILLLLLFNTLACEPAQQISNLDKAQQLGHFTCLSSQNKCHINSEFGRFTIQFTGQVEQGRIQTELPFYIQIKFAGLDEKYQLKSITSHLEGKSMFMGEIPVFFQSDETIANSLIAETLLASCSEDIMTWLLWFQFDVVIEGKIKKQSGFISFDSQRETSMANEK